MPRARLVSGPPPRPGGGQLGPTELTHARLTATVIKKTCAQASEYPEAKAGPAPRNALPGRDTCCRVCLACVAVVATGSGRGLDFRQKDFQDVSKFGILMTLAAAFLTSFGGAKENRRVAIRSGRDKNAKRGAISQPRGRELFLGPAMHPLVLAASPGRGTPTDWRLPDRKGSQEAGSSTEVSTASERRSGAQPPPEAPAGEKPPPRAPSLRKKSRGRRGSLRSRTALSRQHSRPSFLLLSAPSLLLAAAAESSPHPTELPEPRAEGEAPPLGKAEYKPRKEGRAARLVSCPHLGQSAPDRAPYASGGSLLIAAEWLG
ncbi:Hypothetical predicted protein [Podarcis lilfordi]|uniref:Uncharacterized protein n=1 Tax=Podarcis lilfordi TaxID=74358 RepID=A0AA35PE66_9SAUR|nr:Hypothetical predicted protein [Podarcis lilfordi]